MRIKRDKDRNTALPKRCRKREMYLLRVLDLLISGKGASSARPNADNPDKKRVCAINGI
jgi:hypothetical protein